MLLRNRPLGMASKGQSNYLNSEFLTNSTKALRGASISPHRTHHAEVSSLGLVQKKLEGTYRCGSIAPILGSLLYFHFPSFFPFSLWSGGWLVLKGHNGKAPTP